MSAPNIDQSLMAEASGRGLTHDPSGLTPEDPSRFISDDQIQALLDEMMAEVPSVESENPVHDALRAQQIAAQRGAGDMKEDIGKAELPSRYLTIEAAREVMLGLGFDVSLPQMRRLAASKLPFFKSGKRLYIGRNELIASFEAFQKSAMARASRRNGRH